MNILSEVICREEARLVAIEEFLNQMAKKIDVTTDTDDWSSNLKNFGTGIIGLMNSERLSQNYVPYLME